MLFTLEALQAAYGDALFLHFGTLDNPRLIMIDGGPSKVFKDSIKPRFEEMSHYLGVEPIPVELLMVSHIDRDHISGVNALMRHIRDRVHRVADVQSIWHNAFDDIANNTQVAALTDLGSASIASAESLATTSWTIGVAAGVKEGRTLRDLAEDRGIVVNAGAKKGFVARGDKVKFGKLTLRVIGPERDQLLGLQKKWDASISSLAGLSISEKRAKVADFVDESVANLASIVVHAKMDKKTMLLTGDARGDIIWKSLKRARLVKNGKCKVDIFKVPHHGSNRNVTTEFFRKIPAKHYVISGNRAKSHGTNPDVDTLEMITKARGASHYTIHMTHKFKVVEDALKKDRRSNRRNYKVEYREPNATSMWVDLGDALDF